MNVEVNVKVTVRLEDLYTLTVHLSPTVAFYAFHLHLASVLNLCIQPEQSMNQPGTDCTIYVNF